MFDREEWLNAYEAHVKKMEEQQKLEAFRMHLSRCLAQSPDEENPHAP